MLVAGAKKHLVYGSPYDCSILIEVEEWRRWNDEDSASNSANNNL
jgi:hypothetical protein